MILFQPLLTKKNNTHHRNLIDSIYIQRNEVKHFKYAIILSHLSDHLPILHVLAHTSNSRQKPWNLHVDQWAIIIFTLVVVFSIAMTTTDFGLTNNWNTRVMCFEIMRLGPKNHCIYSFISHCLYYGREWMFDRTSWQLQCKQLFRYILVIYNQHLL